MSRPGTRFTLPHLSDEAVAAFADGVLRDGARHRAEQHIAECAECHAAVADQRQTRSLLRSAPLPCLPLGLLERLRTLPSSAPLGGSPIVSGLSADGQPMFAAFGTDSSAARDNQGTAAVPPADGASANLSPHRLHLPIVGLSVVAAATVMVGMLASTAPTAGGGVPAPAGTQSPNRGPVAPANNDPAGGFAPAIDLTGPR